VRFGGDESDESDKKNREKKERRGDGGGNVNAYYMYSEHKSAYRNGRKMRTAPWETRNEEGKKKKVVQTICMEIPYTDQMQMQMWRRILGLALLSGWGRR